MTLQLRTGLEVDKMLKEKIKKLTPDIPIISEEVCKSKNSKYSKNLLAS